MRKNTSVGVIEYVKSVIPLQVEQSTSCKSPSVNKTTVTPPDQILEEPCVRPPNKTNSEHQQRLVNTIDLSGLTTSEREREKEKEKERERERERERESKGHVKRGI